MTSNILKKSTDKIIILPIVIVILIVATLAQTNFLGGIGIPVWQTLLFSLAVIAIFFLVYSLQSYRSKESGETSVIMTSVIVVCTLVDSYFTFQGVKEAAFTPDALTMLITALLVAVVGMALFTFGYWRLAKSISYINTLAGGILFALLLFFLMLAQMVISIQFNILTLTGSRPFIEHMRLNVVPNFEKYSIKVEQQYRFAENGVRVMQNQVGAWRGLADAEAIGNITGKVGCAQECRGLKAQSDAAKDSIDQISNHLSEVRSKLQEAQKARDTWIEFLRNPGNERSLKDIEQQRNLAFDSYRRFEQFNTSEMKTVEKNIRDQAVEYMERLKPIATESGLVLLNQFKRRITSTKAFSEFIKNIKEIQVNSEGKSVTAPQVSEITKGRYIWNNWKNYIPNIGFAFFISWSAALLVFFGLLEDFTRKGQKAAKENAV